MPQIDPKKTYSMHAIIQMGVLGKHQQTVLKKIMQDQLGANLLKAESEGTGRQRRYRILGANLIKYLSARPQ
jgi:hypothetical protein